jgi:hypothetical protein
VKRDKKMERKTKMAKKSDEPVGGTGAPAERSGKAGKSPLHEGPAGGGPVVKSKFAKESRDSVEEKEPEKSRGAGG